MRKIILLFIITFSCCVKGQELDSEAFQIIVPKVGLADYPIDKTTLSEIITTFGNDYEKNQEFILKKSKQLPEFYEVKYKSQGISFYFFDNDSTQTIKAVKFYKPFKGKTATNIILNQSNFRKVLNKDKNSKMIISTSDSYNKVGVDEARLTTTGISYSAPLSRFNKFPSKEVLQNMVIEEIYISNYQYQIFLD